MSVIVILRGLPVNAGRTPWTSSKLLNDVKRLSCCALFVALSFWGGTSAFAQNRSGTNNRTNLKVSRDLQEALRTGADTQRVIISVKSGYRASVRRALESHGDLIQSEHP